MNCAFCGEQLDDTHPNTFHKVEGWVRLRSTGGMSAITLPVQQAEVAHSACIDRQRQIKQGHAPPQEETLF